jgi:hypothetical protein
LLPELASRTAQPHNDHHKFVDLAHTICFSWVRDEFAPLLSFNFKPDLGR